MRARDFDKLVRSVKQAGRIRRGKTRASRTFKFRPADIKAIREGLGNKAVGTRRGPLWSEDGAESALEFLEEVRAFVINYSVGHRLVREHVEARGGTADRPETRWREFELLLRSPLVASTLQTDNRSSAKGE